ncbi:hypothetical protein [Paraburkholderia sp. J8-2]|uniref:hypothetical protein n=1 Tax=Paraburkholderia sp. J8-2 TaxID=2805440 RepID=UPI002AB6BB56|nr:hypothetical protein [Paraburkholderia sp. J8-2]
MQSSWDPASGGELGQGFYIIAGAQKTSALYLYGYGVAQAANQGVVDIWEVTCDVELSTLARFDVTNDLQWGNMTRQLCDDYDYLTNANETEPKAQLKFNQRAYSHLTIRLHESLSADAAINRADQLLAQQ